MSELSSCLTEAKDTELVPKQCARQAAAFSFKGPAFAGSYTPLPKPQLGKWQTGQLRHSPPWPSPARWSFVIGVSVTR